METIRRPTSISKQLAGILLLFLMMLNLSCNDNIIFEEHKVFEQQVWKKSDIVKLEPEITDTLQPYNIIFNVRHSNQYYNNNLWVRIETIYPSGRSQEDVVDIPMANKEGRWYGSGSGNVINNEVQIQERALFPEKGKYTLLIEQYMRMESLPEIMNVGIRLEKATN